jgi:diguanylate cyclase (GGDEF)-like protein
VTPEFLNYLVFVASLFWLTLTIAVKLIFRTIRLTQQAEIARNRDELTGLPNPLLFSNYVQELLSKDTQSRFAFVVFDVDNFKAFNERYGFGEGDAALKALAATLRKLFGERYVTRVSCDMFRVIGDVAGMNFKVKEIHDKIHAFSKQGALEVKAGVYAQREPNENIERCFMRARLAETSIKGRYDEYVAVYVDEMSSRERLKMYLITHIDEAIENEHIKVFFQPVIDVKTNKLCGFEALARWMDPVHGMISPLDFIGVLEEAHLIHKLDVFVLKKVCEQYRKEADLGHKCVPVSFNLSRLDFKLSEIYKEVKRFTDMYNVPHEMLHIEITESVLEDDDGGYIKEQIKRFQDEKFEVWMDDFGSGYSSLNMLKDYDFDFTKIDMVFLRNFTEKSKVVIQSMVEMAKRLHLGTLAEGVETQEHLEFLKAIGCDRVQGYYFSKPLPYDEVMKVLEEKGISA